MANEPAYEVAKNIWRIPAAAFDFVNIYALVDDDGGVTLVDTGVKSSQKRTVAGLAAIGKTVRDVQRIVLTHAHSDHAGNAAHLAEEAGLAGVAISAVDAPFARLGQAPGRDSSTRPGRLLNRIPSGPAARRPRAPRSARSWTDDRLRRPMFRGYEERRSHGGGCRPTPLPLGRRALLHPGGTASRFTIADSEFEP
ncbi:MAG: MBL fold metallo-hydrolase [Catenulispora sp.]|nr:MBL fold metallo-hydrolase [Catenulispora sp.]